MAVWNSIFWDSMLVPIIDGAIFVTGCLIVYYIGKMIFHKDHAPTRP